MPDNVKDDVNFTNIVKPFRFFIDITAIPSRAAPRIIKCTVIINIAQVVLFRPNRESDQINSHVITLVLANGFGHVLVVHNNGSHNKTAVSP